jgi:integrase
MADKVHLTKRTVEALEPADAAYEVRDDKIPGFYVRVHQSGAKSFRLTYKRDGIKKVITLGLLGDGCTVEQARAKAEAERGAIVTGGDPIEDRKKERRAREEERRRAVILSELVERWLVEGRDAAPAKRETAWETDARMLRRHMIPLLGKVLVRDLTKGDIEKAQRQIMAGKTALDEKTGFRGRAIVKGGPSSARRAVMALSSCMSWAVDQGIITANPCARVKKMAQRTRQRFLSEAEAAALFDALNALEEQATQTDRTQEERERERARLKLWNDAVRLLLLTGARKSEILALRWIEVDLDRGLINLTLDRNKTGEKSGEKHIALNSAARAILATRPRDSEFVFPSPRIHGAGATGLQRAWERARIHAGLPDVRLHDMRHSFASFAAASGASILLISKALGHTQSATTQRYAHLGRDPVRDLAEGIGQKIMRPCTGGSEIVNLNAGRKDPV